MKSVAIHLPFLSQYFLQVYQRTPWGVENLTNDTPPKRGFGPPLVRYVSTPSGVSALFFLYKNPRQSRPEALLEGSKNFRESAFSGTFSSPHTFCTPPHITAQMYALFFAESAVYTTNLYHDMAPIFYRDAFAEVLGAGVVGTPPTRW